MKKTITTKLSLFVGVLFAALVAMPVMTARAAIISDGVWTQSAAPGTTTVTFDTTTGINVGDKIVLTFPGEAVVDAAGTDITMTGQTTPTRVNDAAANTVTVTADTAVAAAGTVAISMTDGLTSYDDSVFIQQSVSIEHTTAADLSVDSGLALITNDNVTTVTATVAIQLTLALDDDTMDLGVLNPALVNSVSQTYTLSTNNPAGATLHWTSEASGLDKGADNIDDVADGAVTAGSEEYGVELTGTGLTVDAPYSAGDNPLPNAVTQFANTGGVPVTNGTVDVTYKASIDNATAPGSYDEIVTVTAIANP